MRINQYSLAFLWILKSINQVYAADDDDDDVDATATAASSSSSVLSIPPQSSTALPSVLAALYAEDINEQIEGTWSSKSNQVFTGPGFFDPIDELLIEPSLPGISYSFTKDGYWEQATYQVSGNPKDPSCPSAALVWQHGTYKVLDNGTMILTPIAYDGRMLLSEPCKDNGTSIYMRYNSTITFKSVAVTIDDYHGMYKLQIYQFDGSMMQPLYLAYKPPMMLPTETINVEPAETSGVSKRSLRQVVKRNLENRGRTNAQRISTNYWNSNTFWYLSTGLLGVGSLLFLLS